MSRWRLFASGMKGVPLHVSGGLAASTLAMGVIFPTFVACSPSAPATTSPFTSSTPSSSRPQQVPCEVCGVWKEGLPVFTAREVRLHNNRRERVWVTFREGVYDVTDFLDLHPGGPEKLLLASGRDVEDYWRSFPQHFEGVVGAMLEKYRVGNIVVSSTLQSRKQTAGVGSEGPLAWMGSFIWGAAVNETTVTQPQREPLKAHHDQHWEAWKKALHEADGNLCTKEGIDNPVDAELAAKRDAARRKVEEIEAKRALFSAQEAERLRQMVANANVSNKSTSGN